MGEVPMFLGALALGWLVGYLCRVVQDNKAETLLNDALVDMTANAQALKRDGIRKDWAIDRAKEYLNYGVD